MIDFEAARYLWHPIASSDDLHFRHVFHAQLLGRELALWRADDGRVNAWENRCLHRGVRLSIGINDGTELICQYHGWRYANGTAGCTYIPAHPADAPARTICNNTYPVMERFGLVWCAEVDDAGTPRFSLSEESEVLTPLRAITINADAEHCSQALIEFLKSHPVPERAAQGAPQCNQVSAFELQVMAPSSAIPYLIIYLQPKDAGRTCVRALLSNEARQSDDSSGLTPLLKQYSHWLEQARRAIEQQVTEVPVPWVPLIPRVSESLSRIPPQQQLARGAALRTRIASIETLGSDVRVFRLEALHKPLPTAQPGAHIDVHLPNGLVRQYSLINGPGQSDHYAIAVKRLADSSGGSEAMHHTLKVGDVLATSVPRNNFTLRRDAELTLLIAGGIGITPLLSMARTLHHSGLPFALHYFLSSEQDAIFRDELEAMAGDINIYTGLSVEQTGSKLSGLLSTPLEHQHLYLCGPPPMLDLIRKTALSHAWPDSAIHFEYFKNINSCDDSIGFVAELARSGLTLEIPAGQTLLQVLQENNVAVPSSCEQGACGTCKVTVLSGTPEHQDVYLSDAEKARGDCLMSCVSRAKTDKLVLDL